MRGHHKVIPLSSSPDNEYNILYSIQAPSSSPDNEYIDMTMQEDKSISNAPENKEIFAPEPPLKKAEPEKFAPEPSRNSQMFEEKQPLEVSPVDASMASSFVFIDFDKTITSEHTHNRIGIAYTQKKKELGKQVILTEEEQWALVKDIKPIGSAKQWENIFSMLINNNQAVCIASFTHFKHVIPLYLKEVIGLPEDLIKKIHIEAWLPANTSNKNVHIQNAIHDCHFKGSQKQVLLIDDSESNILAAKEKGYLTITAKLDGSHLEAIKKESVRLKNMYTPRFFNMKQEGESDKDYVTRLGKRRRFI
jgi:hypothetical protein